ncbi:glycoside hydrolase family 3 N-terminal domain-containing protein [Hamadaea sp.]|uniref:glycoside hydrolase family 3 protein n=1 Tax=Hamadaea sp. TaxID=2024425 RepID=UPI0025BE53B1|nr:glycoside hydrolase family 3 N-terminal domain-containing protein [Hamadaea sp.]
MRRNAAAILTGCALALTACGTAPATPESSPSPTTLAGRVALLSDEDLAGQVLMPYAYGQDATQVSAGAAKANQKMAGVRTPAELVAKLRLGGVILVGFEAGDPTAQDTANVDRPEQVRKFTAGLQAAAAKLPAGSPLLIGTDQEYGVVTRVKTGVTLLPSAMALGAANKPELTEAAWRTAGTELAAMGINVDFAPDADVQGESSVIGSRSFGSDSALVAEQAAAAVRGLQAAGVAATLKHFPGHGRPAADSHGDLPQLKQTRKELAEIDLPPFQAGIKAGAMLIMSGHLDVRAIDPGMPASFSAKVLDGVLRQELGFQGVVVTDALNMAPAERWPAGEAAVRALQAGNDLLLMPPDPVAAYNGILTALKTGKLSRDRLRESVTRIQTLKHAVADDDQPGLDVLAGQTHQAAVAAAASAAVTQLRGACGAALVTGPVGVTAAKGRESSRDHLVKALQAQGVRVEQRPATAGAQVVHLVGYGDTAGDLNAKATIAVAMDTPYILAKSPAPILLATYSSSPSSLDALAAVLAGKAKAEGRSPVAVNGLPRSSCS